MQSKKRQHFKVFTGESDVDSLVTLLYVLSAEWKLKPKMHRLVLLFSLFQVVPAKLSQGYQLIPL